jgi:hypothetical protein
LSPQVFIGEFLGTTSEIYRVIWVKEATHKLEVSSCLTARNIRQEGGDSANFEDQNKDNNDKQYSYHEKLLDMDRLY